jgi:hypothetical protein
MSNLFEQIAEASRPKETLKMYTFKPSPSTRHTEDEMETVIAPSLGAAIRKNPEMLKWYLFSISK